MTVSDRIAVMQQGKIVQVAPPAEMYEQPVNRYVADFLGNINLVAAKVAKSNGGSATLETELGDALKVHCQTDCAVGDNVWMAARPEKMTISLDRPKSGNQLAGTVWDIAYLGDLTIFKVKLDSGEFARVSVLNNSLSDGASHSITWEDKVWLSVDPESALVLTE